LIRNSILEHWEKIRRERAGPALLSPSGEILRTWQEVEDESRTLGREIARGVGGVAVQTGNDPSVPAILLACWRSGRAVVLHDPEFQGAARSRVEGVLGVTVRITRQLNGDLAFSPLPNEERTAPDICFHKVTAGTDAGLRLIGFTAGQLLADCEQIAVTMGIGSQDVNYGLVAFSHSYGFSSLITPLLCRGTALVVAGDSLPWAMEAGLRLTKASVLPLVPAMFRALLSVRALPPSVRLCVSAGVALDPLLAAAFAARFGLKIHSFYGTSDCGGICYDASEDPVGEPGFVGQPLSGVSIEMCSPEAAEGSRIRVRSPAAASGGSSGNSSDPCDLLMRSPRGFRLVGKESDIINVAGKKAHPAEIESVLLEIPGVADAVVCGAADVHRGEEICALILSPESIDAATVRRHCANRLPSWQVPRRIRVLAAFPPEAARENRRKFASRSFA